MSQPTTSSGVPIKHYVDRKREKTRTKVMIGLLIILGMTIIGTFVLIWCDRKPDSFIQTVFPALTTLIGSALGFYFGGGRDIGEAEEEEEQQPPP